MVTIWGFAYVKASIPTRPFFIPSTVVKIKSWSKRSFDNVKTPLTLSPLEKLTTEFSPNVLKGKDSNILYNL